MEIVYVHLGKSNTNYLIPAIQRSLSIYPTIKHTLIVENPDFFISLPMSINLIPYEGRVLESKFKEREVDGQFRMGYWNLTLERIFAVLNYQIRNNLGQILHIESDVILLETFPFLDLERCKNAHWCEYGPGHDVASLLHIPDSRSALNIQIKMFEVLSRYPNLTDMQLLHLIRNEVSNVRLFPSNATNDCIKDLNNSEMYCNCTPSDFIFDGLTYGMYLSGQDPRNNYGRYSIGDNSPFESGATQINPRDFSWFLDDSGKLNAKCSHCYEVASLQNLHVHSKNIDLFEPNWRLELERLVNIANKHERVNYFSLKVVYEMSIYSFKNGNFWEFVLKSPPITTLKRFILKFMKVK